MTSPTFSTKFPPLVALFNPMMKTRFLLKHLTDSVTYEKKPIKHDKRDRKPDDPPADQALIFTRAFSCQVYEAFLITNVFVSFPDGLPKEFEDVRVKAELDGDVLFHESLREHLGMSSRILNLDKAHFKALQCGPEMAKKPIGHCEASAGDPTEPQLGILSPHGTQLTIELNGLPVEATLNVRRGVIVALYTSKTEPNLRPL